MNCSKNKQASLKNNHVKSTTHTFTHLKFAFDDEDNDNYKQWISVKPSVKFKGVKYKWNFHP